MRETTESKLQNSADTEPEPRESACCARETRETCCAASSKASCCGTSSEQAPPSRCGCR
jgi:hypothetical protein